MTQTQPAVSETESSMVSIRKSATDLLNLGQDFVIATWKAKGR